MKKISVSLDRLAAGDVDCILVILDTGTILRGCGVEIQGPSRLRYEPSHPQGGRVWIETEAKVTVQNRSGSEKTAP